MWSIARLKYKLLAVCFYLNKPKIGLGNINDHSSNNPQLGIFN